MIRKNLFRTVFNLCLHGVLAMALACVLLVGLITLAPQQVMAAAGDIWQMYNANNGHVYWRGLSNGWIIPNGTALSNTTGFGDAVHLAYNVDSNCYRGGVQYVSSNTTISTYSPDNTFVSNATAVMTFVNVSTAGAGARKRIWNVAGAGNISCTSVSNISFANATAASVNVTAGDCKDFTSTNTVWLAK